MYTSNPGDPNKWPGDFVGVLNYHLDFFQLIYAQRYRLPDLRNPKGEAWLTWENTMRLTFENSPALCIQLERVEATFGDEFKRPALDYWCKQK